MFYMLIAILIFSLIIIALNRISNKVLVCPICAATILTWLAALLAMYFNLLTINNLFLAILMAISLGASVEKYGSKFGIWWKILTVLLGAPAIYYLVQSQILLAIYLLLALLFGTALMTMQFSAKSAKGAYKDTFKDCCN